MNAALQRLHTEHLERRGRMHAVRAAPARYVEIFPRLTLYTPSLPYIGAPVQVLADRGDLHVVAFEKFRLSLIDRSQLARPPIAVIIAAAASHFGVSIEDIKSKRPGAILLRARHIAMWIARVHGRRSFPEIGKLFGGRHHTTVLKAVRDIAPVIEMDACAAEVAAIVTQIDIWASRQKRLAPPPPIMRDAHVLAFEHAKRVEADKLGGLSIIAVIAASAQHFDLTIEDITSVRRGQVRIRARHIAMWIARVHGSRSFPKIAQIFGGRDHTTIMHAVGKMEELAATEAYAADIEAIMALVRDGAHH